MVLQQILAVNSAITEYQVQIQTHKIRIMNHELRIIEKLKYELSAIRYTLYPSKGFTLVELLIVIAIIGVLSAILMANFVGVRQRARDAQRKTDLRQIQSALELYRADIGSYPISPLPNCGSSLSGGTPSVVIYMQKIPCDTNPNDSPYAPSSGNYNYISSDGKTYAIYACLENTNDNDSSIINGDTNCNSTSSTRDTYRLTNP